MAYICRIIKNKYIMFVVRDTNHPAEDLARNWSGFAGGSCQGEDGGFTEDEARENYAAHTGVDIDEVDIEFRFHPAYGEFVAVDYDGLGAFALESATIKDAIKEGSEYEDGLAVCTEAGDGHFYAEDCVSFHEVRPGRYVFEIK